MIKTLDDNDGRTIINQIEYDTMAERGTKKHVEILKNEPIEADTISSTSNNRRKKSGTSKLHKLRRQLSANINSVSMIKLKILLLVVGYMVIQQACLVHSGFWTFYFPNLLKPKGFNELSDMIVSVAERINETKDCYADSIYFWGLMKEFDTLPSDSFYPEDSACSDVFPLFRDLAIEYAKIDYEHYILPYEEYLEYLTGFRLQWYPAGIDSKAALPREWEHMLIKTELEGRIKWMKKLVETKEYQDIREKMIEIWKNVRRSLDTSLPCLFLRYAFHQVSEDINQLALEANLKDMGESMKAVEAAFTRIEKYKGSDAKIISQIEEEIKKEARLRIQD